MKGKIKRYHKTKGFGFIKTKDQKDIFFHISEFVDAQVKVDEEVEFEVVKTNKGLKAIKVKKIKNGT